jgi:hypothetical protein
VSVVGLQGDKIDPLQRYTAYADTFLPMRRSADTIPPGVRSSIENDNDDDDEDDYSLDG